MNNLMYKFNQFRYNLASKFQRFMVGRYGVDDLFKFVNFLTWALIIISLFARSGVLNFITLALIFYNYFRAFSKSYQKRYNENQLYLKLSKGIRSFVKLQIRRFKERKNYCFRTCPNCKKTLRLPNKKGKHTVNCPNCRMPFDVRI